MWDRCVRVRFSPTAPSRNPYPKPVVSNRGVAHVFGTAEGWSAGRRGGALGGPAEVRKGPVRLRARYVSHGCGTVVPCP